MTAEQLGGGVANAGLVTREGDVVRRPLPPNAATLHRLLDHLAATGFQAPQPLAVEGDREVVRFIPGDVAVPPFPAWSMTDDVLRDVGAFLRRYHEAVAGFDPPATATWSAELADPNGGPIVCHNDVCPENIVFQDGRAVALLDFDFAAPGRAVWDVAQTARYWCPLTDPALADEIRRPPFDPFHRLATFVDAYGLGNEERRTFVDVLIETEEVSVKFVLGQIARGHRHFAEMWRNGGEARFERKMRWLDANRTRLGEAVHS